MENRFAFFGLLAGLAFLPACSRQTSAPVESTTQALGYHCPMHPQYHSDKPGNCPICQMKLVPDNEPEAAPTGVAGQANVKVAAGREQLIGVKVAKAELRDLYDQARASAKVAYDPGLYSAILEHREAVAGLRKASATGSSDFLGEAQDTVDASRLRLRQLGLSDQQIRQAGKADFNPSNLLLGQAGGKVWIYIDLYENEARLVKPGQKTTFESTSFPGHVFEGTVRSVDQVVNAETRTLRARAEVPNPQGDLKPDMYLNATVYIPMGRKLAIPETAVMDTGTRQLVYVANGDGHYEPRVIRVGREAGGYYEVIEGLHEGDNVVTSANFFIDSESKIRGAAQGK